MKIFENYAKSYSAICEQRVVDLCLVSKYRNTVAYSTPQLWTKTNISFPFADRHPAAVLSRSTSPDSRRSTSLSISVIQARTETSLTTMWTSQSFLPTSPSGSNIMTLLRHTETRWKSIKAVSQTWLPFYRFMEGWTFTHLPSLESISMERQNSTFDMRDVPFDS